MSKSLYVNYIDVFDKPHFIVTLDDKGGDALFDLLKPLFEKTMADEEFWLEEYDNAYQKAGFIEFDDLPAEIFMQAHTLIQQSNEPALTPYVGEIAKKMQADPRYTPTA